MFDNFRDKVDLFEKIIEGYGGASKGKEKYIFRKNIGEQGKNFPDGAFFGCINKEENYSGAYQDLSVVVFPSNESEDKDDKWIVALAVGIIGYRNDYDIASIPGTRRMFINNLRGLDEKSFIKNDFLDIESKDGFKNFCECQEIPESLDNSVNKYQQVVLSSTIVAPNSEACERIMRLYLAIYAKIRMWPTNKAHRAAISQALKNNNAIVRYEEDDIKKLLKNRKYIVLQGAPGTGKTRMAKRLAAGGSVFFTQFHAETSYSDFIYGILPRVNSEDLKYDEKYGVFVEAIKAAENNKNKNIYLIIDEINRANLSNVLGSAFYLFEPTMQESNITIDVCPGVKLGKLPENLYVIATMNTADRSLAVVDFALRRRFAWYTMVPHAVDVDDDELYFCEEEFNTIKGIFEQYASDDELNVMPGQAYFIVKKDIKDEHIEERLRYEILPLIKEYILDGMLVRAKDDFVNYFRERINEEMFR